MVGGPHSLENGWAGDGQPHNISCGETVLCAQLQGKERKAGQAWWSRGRVEEMARSCGLWVLPAELL